MLTKMVNYKSQMNAIFDVYSLGWSIGECGSKLTLEKENKKWFCPKF